MLGSETLEETVSFEYKQAYQPPAVKSSREEGGVWNIIASLNVEPLEYIQAFERRGIAPIAFSRGR